MGSFTVVEVLIVGECSPGFPAIAQKIHTRTWHISLFACRSASGRFREEGGIYAVQQGEHACNDQGNRNGLEKYPDN